MSSANLFKRLSVLSLAFVFVLSSCVTSPTRYLSSAEEFDCSEQQGARYPAASLCSAVHRPVDAARFADEQEVFSALKLFRNTEIKTEDAQAMYRPVKLRRDWSKDNDDAFYGSLIGYERVAQVRAEGRDPVIVFGEETSYNYNAAVRRLNDIPVGQFKVDQLIVSEVNRDIISSYQTHLKFLRGEQKSKRFQYPSRLLKALNGYLAEYGGRFKRRPLTDWSVAFTPMSEADYAGVLRNRAVSGIDFVQLPWSRKGARYGIFTYPREKVAQESFSRLMEDTNARIQAIKNGTSKEDPIDLAAEFQWKFVQTHPMVDGNGRTGRALMNRILAEFGLPPSSRHEIDRDLTLTLEEQKTFVRNGVVDSLRLALPENKKGELKDIEGRIGIFRRGFGTRYSLKELKELLKDVMDVSRVTNVKELIPSSEAQIFTLDGKKFTLGDDLFLHDEYGVPHAVSFENARYEIFPLTDRTYTLYAAGGKFTGEKKVQFDMPDHSRLVVKDVLELMRRIQGIDSSGEKAPPTIKVHDYTKIELANRNDDFHFYQWQIPMLLRVARIEENPETNPMAVLVQNRGFATGRSYIGRTKFEQAFFFGEKTTDVSEIIGQYVRQDQAFYEMKRAIEKSEMLNEKPELREKLIKDINLSRLKLHTAGRVMLKDFLTQLNKLDQADWTYLKSHPQFRLVFEYFIRTPLAYPTLQQARAKFGDETMPVIRSQAGDKASWIGFISDAQIRGFLKSVPFLGPRWEKLIRETSEEIKRLREEEKVVKRGQTPDPVEDGKRASLIARLVADYKKDDPIILRSLSNSLQWIFREPYAIRRLDPEMGRAFVTQYLHTQLDVGPKEKLSTTTNPEYLLAPKKKEPDQVYAKFAQWDPTVYIIQAPRDGVQIDNATGYIIQMEAGMKPMGPIASRSAIAFKLRSESTDEMGARNSFYLPKAPATDRAQSLMDLVFRNGAIQGAEGKGKSDADAGGDAPGADAGG